MGCDPWRGRGGALPPVDGFGVGGHAVPQARDELRVAAPAAAETERPELPRGAVVVMDRLIYGMGIDLAGAIGAPRSPLCLHGTPAQMTWFGTSKPAAADDRTAA